MSVETDPAPDADLFEAALWAVQALSDAGVTTEALAILHPARRTFMIRRNPHFERLDEVWRIGRILLSTRARVYCHGKTTRSTRRERLGLQSLSQEERRDVAGFAYASGFETGTEVNFDAVPLPLNRQALANLALRTPNAPLTVVDGEVRVLWRTGADPASAPEFEAYLRDRVELMIQPPGTTENW